MSIQLPKGWAMEGDRGVQGVIISAPVEHGGGGFVTVDERRRNFALGIGRVSRDGSYSGRGWKDQLYADAVAALKRALDWHWDN